MVLLVPFADVISHSVLNITLSCSVPPAGFVLVLFLHIFPKWWSLSQQLHLVPKAGHSVLLSLVGGFLPCPLVPQYVQMS